MKKRFLAFHLDFLGFFASMLCAIHCALVPIVLALGALSGLIWLTYPFVEWLFIAASILIASWSLVQSYFKRHQRLLALYVVSLGFLFLIASRLVEGQYEVVLSVLGGVTIATAHWCNWKLLQEVNFELKIK